MAMCVDVGILHSVWGRRLGLRVHGNLREAQGWLAVQGSLGWPLCLTVPRLSVGLSPSFRTSPPCAWSNTVGCCLSISWTHIVQHHHMSQQSDGAVDLHSHCPESSVIVIHQALQAT